nr:unnamed protein product [Spirometra erinaceieuropaei]
MNLRIDIVEARFRLVHRRRPQDNNELAQRLDKIPVTVAVAAADENASVENRCCQQQDTVQSTALTVLGRARRQHQDCLDSNDVAICDLLAEKNRLHKASVNRPTDGSKGCQLTG